MFHPSHWAGCEIRFQSYPRPSLSPGRSPSLYYFTQAYTPWGLALFPILPPPGPARGCSKHSGSAPAPLKGFEPIQGLCREGTKMGGWGVGRARTFPRLTVGGGKHMPALPPYLPFPLHPLLGYLGLPSPFPACLLHNKERMLFRRRSGDLP